MVQKRLIFALIGISAGLIAAIFTIVYVAPANLMMPLIGIASSMIVPVVSSILIAILISPIRAQQVQIHDDIRHIKEMINGTYRKMESELAEVRAMNSALQEQVGKSDV
jgi:uncharacterized membrane protein (DUF106 family)